MRINWNARHKAFTLIEVLVTAFLTVIGLALIYNSLQGSVRNTKEAQLEINIIKTTSTMGEVLRRDLYGMRGSAIPIDLAFTKEFAGEKRIYNQGIYKEDPSGFKFIKLPGTEVSFNLAPDGSVSSLKISSASYFSTGPSVVNTSFMMSMFNGFVQFLDHQLDIGENSYLADIYFLNTTKGPVVWTYYRNDLKDNKKVVHQVSRTTLNEWKSGIRDGMIFGSGKVGLPVSDPESQSKVCTFSIVALFGVNCIYFSNGGEWHGFGLSPVQVRISSYYGLPPEVDPDHRHRLLEFGVKDPYFTSQNSYYRLINP